MPTNKSANVLSEKLTAEVGAMEGIERRKDLEGWQRILQIRHFKVLHTFQHTKLELRSRGWNKLNHHFKPREPLSLLYLFTLAQFNVMGQNQDEETRLITQTCYYIMDEVASEMSRKKYTEFEKWEQAQNSLEIIERFIEKCTDKIVKEIAT